MDTVEMCLFLFVVIIISVCFLRYDQSSKLLKDMLKLQLEMNQLYDKTTLALRKIDEKMTALEAPVAFLVHTVSDMYPTRNTQLRFIDTVTNTGGAYDTSSGYFTAPVSGTYWFSVQIPSQYKTRVHIQIYAENTLIGNSAMKNGDCCSAFTCCAVAVLNVGDKVCVKNCKNSASIYQDADRWAVFSGALVH